MKCLVTGAAGFIGSHLSERLLLDGHDVVGVDRISDYYDPALKRGNLAVLKPAAGFTLHEIDLAADDVSGVLAGVDIVFHLAAQAGVRASWGASFDGYVTDNIIATQRLLEACKERELAKFVYAGTSSVYGDAEAMPTPETTIPRPVSPYGVTKLASEHLCSLYATQFDVPVTAVRYFTVYGPRQRPDMAFNKFIRSMMSGESISVFGDGLQTRDFTFVEDAVTGTLQAGLEGPVGAVMNIGGGSRVALAEVIAVIEELAGTTARIEYADRQKGDARHTSADISLAHELIGYTPQTNLRDGLAAQIQWHRSLG
jgi:UDP-glucose 4-epimerase